MKKVLLTLSAVMLFAVLFCFNASALEATGNCGAEGDNVTWSFNETTGELVISGEGNMIDYYGASSAFGEYSNSPFFKNEEIKSVVIKNGVTSIADFAFRLCVNLVEVTISDSVVKIGSNAFSNCERLTSVIIGNGLTTIGRLGFAFCTELKDIYYTGTEDQWQNINIDSMSKRSLDNATIHYNYNIPCTHETLTIIEAVAPTCTEAGSTEGAKCTTCGEVTVSQTTILALGHTEVTVKAVAPTYTKTGLTEGKKCSECGKVTVKQKKVAKKKLKKVTVKSVKSTKAKTATVTWKKVTDASGYIVEYSTTKKFTKKTTKKVTIKKGKTTKTNLKKLKSGKKYYVRVKAYRTENKKTVYGSYSSVKTVKIK